MDKREGSGPKEQWATTFSKTPLRSLNPNLMMTSSTTKVDIRTSINSLLSVGILFRDPPNAPHRTLRPRLPILPLVHYV